MIRKGEVPGFVYWAYTALLGIFAIYVAWQISEVVRGGRPDPMLFSGGLVCLVGLGISLTAKRRLRDSLERLRYNGALVGTADQLKDVEPAIEAAALRSAWAGATICAVAEALVIISAYFIVPLLPGIEPPKLVWLQFILLLVATTLAAAVVGWFLGTFAVYGNFQRYVVRTRCRIWISPRADDGMGGLAPFVSIFRRQAILTLAPAAWIAFCLAVMATSAWLLDQYGFWRFPLLMLLLVAIFYAILGFYRPALMLERTLATEEARIKQMGPNSQLEDLHNARARITPHASTFLMVLAILVGAILVSGLFLPPVGGRSPFSVFLFGP